MNKDPMVFAMANPTPEIFPADAKQPEQKRRHGQIGLPQPGE
jgi:malic enzyme